MSLRDTTAGDPYDDMTEEEFWANLSAAKGEPFTRDEWRLRVDHLEKELRDARRRLLTAEETGHCKAARFG